jgi:hypothetical protein
MSVSRSVREPLFDAQVNCIGLINVLDAAAKTGLPPGRLRLERWRALWRGHVAGTRIDARQPGQPLRHHEVGRRTVSEVLCRRARPRDGGPPLFQRLRSATEPARRGGRGGDLLQETLGRESPPRSTATAAISATMSSVPTWPGPTCIALTHDLPAGAAQDAHEPQHRHRHRHRRQRPRGDDSRRLSATPSPVVVGGRRCRRRSTGRPDRVTCGRTSSIRPLPATCSAGSRQSGLPMGWP